MRFIPLGLFALLLAACGGGGAGGPQGQLAIRITDAPFPSDYVLSATVVIREVRVHTGGDEDDADDGDDDGAGDGGGGWTTVFEGSQEIDLVPLTGGVSELLVLADLPVGSYDRFRLIVEAGEVTLDPSAVVEDEHVFNTENGNMLFPSGAQSGIKVNVEGGVDVVTSLTADLTFDFDLAKSFVFNGPPTHAPGVRRVLFKPVVRGVNTTTAGTLALDAISDNATPLDDTDDVMLPGATVRILDGDGVETVVIADGDGHVETSLPAGTYDVTVEAAGHEPAEVLGVEIFLANLTDLGDVILVASEAEIVGVVSTDLGTPLTDDDVPLLGATVDARVVGDATMTVVASDTTDDQGAFQLAMLAPGDYELTISAAGHTTQVLASVTSTPPAAAAGVNVLLVATGP